MCITFFLLNHSLSLDKLNGLGIASSVINWYTCYLRGYIQLVLLNGVMSDLMDVIIGVPQGSILGPLLFTIFINELTTSRCTECSVHFYADDPILHRQSESLSELEPDLVRDFKHFGFASVSNGVLSQDETTSNGRRVKVQICGCEEVLAVKDIFCNLKSQRRKLNVLKLC